jgi:hypothetical protein
MPLFIAWSVYSSQSSGRVEEKFAPSVVGAQHADAPQSRSCFDFGHTTRMTGPPPPPVSMPSADGRTFHPHL